MDRQGREQTGALTRAPALTFGLACIAVFAPLADALAQTDGPIRPAPADTPPGADVPVTDLWGFIGRALSAEEMALLSLTFALVAFSVLAAILYVRTKTRFQAYREVSERNRTALAARMERAESLLNAEPQVLLTWEGSDDAPEVEFGTDRVDAVPPEAARVVDFRSWLRAESAQALEHAVTRLRERGTAFEQTVSTSAGTALEVHGRTSGARAIVRIRNATGPQRELAELRERHLKLSRELQALHGLLDTLDTPAWVRDENGNLFWVNDAFARPPGPGPATRRSPGALRSPRRRCWKRWRRRAGTTSCSRATSRSDRTGARCR